MNVGLMLSRMARRDGTRPAVYRGNAQIWTYAELDQRASNVARHLRHNLRLASGARVGILMTNVPEYLPILFGVWYAGLVAVPINCKLHPNEVSFILENCSASAVFADGASIDGLAEIKLPTGCTRLEAQSSFGGGDGDAANPLELSDCPDSHLAWLFYTSGTTGRPKGVMLSHANLMAMVACYFAGVDTVETRDGVVYAAPLSHGAGLYGLPFVLKGARHIFPESGHFDPAELLGLALHHRELVMFAAPTMVKRFVRHIRASGEDPAGFKTILYGGGPMYAEDIREALATMGQRFVQIYGQGESPMTITVLDKEALADTAHPRYAARLGSVGTTQALVEVRVVDAEGSPLPPESAGEVTVRGSTVMLGYWGDPDATRRAVRNGWLWTGDIGRIDRDGFLTLQDRSKDVIISGGSNIYPREVEEVLLRDPAVREVSVVGRPSAEWGEEVVAFVVLHPNLSTSSAALDLLCNTNIARFKKPKAYRFVASLPKNHYGKVLKTELRHQASADACE